MHESSDTSWECDISLRKEYDENNKPLSDTRRGTHSFFKALQNPRDVELMVYRAQKALLNPSKSSDDYLKHELADISKETNEIEFTMNAVCLYIRGPNVPNLNLVDLPGIVGKLH